MSRVQLLYDLVQDLRTVADDFQAIADALMQTDAEVALPEQKAIPQASTAPAADTADDAPTVPITKEHVRDVLKRLSRSGYRDAVQNLILSYGVGTFSELPESEYPDILKRAEEIEHQVDKSGMPYVFHPFHVAEQMTTEETTVVALLHDVVEDTDYTIADLREMGFPEPVTAALTLLTHKDGVPYMDYVAAIKSDPIASAVKLADLRHNSDLTRLDVVDEKALRRVEKYKKAITLLETEAAGT